MKTLFLESFAGIAGDMFTAAFLDAGLVDAGAIRAVPGLLGLGGVEVEVLQVQRAGARFTQVQVVDHDTGEQTDQHHHHHFSGLARQLEESGLDDLARGFALKVLRHLAEAEADAHGVPVEKVAFHEVGAVDSVVDVAMAGVCVAAVGAHRILASPVKLGRGSIRIQHGTYPVPPPASARLAIGMPVAPVPESIFRPDVELSTPTGLAILKALEPEFVDGWPSGTVRAQGGGAGTTDLGDYPNVFRVALVETEGPSLDCHLLYEADKVVELRCNVDDQTGERTAWLMEKALELGALDGWVTPILGKKGRPASLLSFLAHQKDLGRLVDFLLRRSSTFGVRYSTWDRFKLARVEEVRDTPHGPVSFKVGRTRDGRKMKEKPEFEELRKIWETDPDAEI
jgi:uncharacterized protein (TIGR00299 family) protein